MIRLAVLLALAGCRDFTWRGIPPGATCAWELDIATCVSGDHRIYTCVRNFQKREIACAESLTVRPEPR